MKTRLAAGCVEVFENSVFRAKSNGTYFVVEGVRSERKQEVIVRRAPTGAKRVIEMARFLKDYVWVGSKAILAQMQTS